MNPPIDQHREGVSSHLQKIRFHRMYAAAVSCQKHLEYSCCHTRKRKKAHGIFHIFSFHSTRGMGIFEYMETPITKDCNHFMLTPHTVQSLSVQMWSFLDIPKVPFPTAVSLLPLRLVSPRLISHVRNGESPSSLSTMAPAGSLDTWEGAYTLLPAVPSEPRKELPQKK